MVTEERLRNKALYKVQLFLLKTLPILIALIYLINTITSYYNIDLPILSSIGGMSLITIVFMYISSYVFQFCNYHRLFLHYVVVNDILNIYDWYIGIPISTRNLFIVHMIIAGIFLFLILYLYVKHHKKTTSGNS